MSTVPPRRRARLFAGILAGTALAVAAPLAASAHVHVSPGTAAAGASTTLTFSFSHGCDGAPTTALVIDIPDQATAVTPVFNPGWTSEQETAADGTVSRVTLTASEPVPDGVRADVELDVVLSETAAGEDVAFPVVQECADESSAWTEISDDPEVELDAPAPLVTVGEASAAEDGHHGESPAAEEDHSEEAHGASDQDAANDAAETHSAADPVARWLAGGALAAGLGAVFLAVWRTRRDPR